MSKKEYLKGDISHFDIKSFNAVSLIEQAWDERKQEYKASGHIFNTRNICQSAQGNKEGLRTTVVSAAVFIME